MSLRRIGAVALLAVAVGCGILAYGAFHNLWASYRDSPTSTYVLAGGIWTLFALGCIAAAVRMFRSSV